MAMSGLLNRYTFNYPIQRRGILFPEERSKVVGNNCVFVCKTGAAGQLC